MPQLTLTPQQLKRALQCAVACDALLTSNHESEVSPHARDVYAVWPRMYDDVPPALMACLDDERAEQEEVTFVFWSEDGEQWCQGRAEIPEGMDDGAEWLLDMLQMDADGFIDWGRDYFGAKFDAAAADAVRRVFSQQL